MRELILKFELYINPTNEYHNFDTLAELTIIGHFDTSMPALIKIQTLLVNSREHSDEIQSFLISLIGADAIEKKVIEVLES